jgi:hypothetical protein
MRLWFAIFSVKYTILRAHEKKQKCLFVDLSLILRNSASQIIFDNHTNRYRNKMTFSKLQNLSPLGRYIKLSSNFYKSRHGSMSIFNHELFLIRWLNNFRTPNNRRFFTISDFKIYLLRGYICKMAQIFITYSSEHM